MPNLVIFSVHDSKAEAFIQPLFAPTIAVGKRMFEAAVNDESTEFHRYAGDYTLFAIGEFETESGILYPYSIHKNLGLALTFIKEQE